MPAEKPEARLTGAANKLRTLEAQMKGIKLETITRQPLMVGWAEIILHPQTSKAIMRKSERQGLETATTRALKSLADLHAKAKATGAKPLTKTQLKRLAGNLGHVAEVIGFESGKLKRTPTLPSTLGPKSVTKRLH